MLTVIMLMEKGLSGPIHMPKHGKRMEILKVVPKRARS